MRFDSVAPECFALHTLLREAEYVSNHLTDDVFEAEIIVAIPERRQHCNVVVDVEVAAGPQAYQNFESAFLFEVDLSVLSTILSIVRLTQYCKCVEVERYFTNDPSA